MMGFGRRLKVTLFGSSHGPEVGAEIEGIPKGSAIDVARLQEDLDRRRPVGRTLATKRQEEDRLIVDRGLVAGLADGGPLRAHVLNEDVRREPYDRLRNTPRPGHADLPALLRFGAAADLSGGGIFSGRMTVGLVIAGGVARQLLAREGVEVAAFTRAIGTVEAAWSVEEPLATLRASARSNEVGCPDPMAARRMEELIAEARRAGDSVGGLIEGVATGLPVGLGEPFFDSIESVVAHLAFAIPAVKGVEFGDGFRGARMRGSEHNDPFEWEGDRVRSVTNHAGGILGGMATGAPLVVRVAVKPTSSIARPQRTIDLKERTNVEIVVTGRHDPCIVPRAVVVVEAVTAFALADLALAGGFL
ncbi:MAG: chorismate synthase [Thermoplasmata archaeon]|nr:chorismate synthase [Thermoplasmata archaeon]